MAPATDKRLVYSVPEFCEAHSISRGMLYKLWAVGDGPTRSKIGRKTVITAEAARRWREQLAGEAA
ncbi:MAG: hypothetical protein DWQ36_19590 [Acidobacteria bacterium]|nr:MAG: hypothetical protein DWQ30_06050 [Acidobacteriota bacterium]REK03744.1 MAG: hypothetical protein DWQ36_19590 [Acidobacteriota bacterium]